MKLKSLLPIIGIAILLFILSTLDFDKIIQIFSKIDPLYSVLSFFIIAPLLFLATIEWQLLLRKQKIFVKFWYPLTNFFIGYFYGFITPGAFGAYSRSIYLAEESGAPLPKCVSNIIILNTLEFISILTVGAIGAIYLSSIFPYLFYIIIIAMIVQIAVFLFFFKDERSRVLFRKIVQSRIFSTIKDRIEGSIETFFEDIPKFKDVLLPYGISLSGWFLKYAMLFFVAKLFFIEVPMITFIMIMAVADVLACLPISIYGLGTREAVLITIFEFWGIPRENIVSFSLFWFILIWLTPSIIGAFVTVSETKKSGKFELTDKTINRFVSYLQKYPEFYAHTSEIIKKNIPKKVDKPVIIDLGAGPGLLSSAVGKIIPNAQIIAVDPLKKMIEFAKEEVKFKDFKTLIGSSDNIPVADDFADIVVSRFNLTYWEKPRESFEEIDRVLKPGGKVIIEALNKDLSGFKLFLIKINMFLKLASSDVIKYHADAYKTAYRLKDVEGFLKKIGYKITYKEIDEKEWKFIIIAKK
jgi:uncharacterized protein (TIRG00374 family)